MNTDTKEKLIERMSFNLPVLRAKISMSQARLAEMVGVSRQTIVAIENKKRKMLWNTFMACFLVFYKNAETNLLMKVYKIYTDELEAFLTEPNS